ncbi:MAG: c-type cytochrome, partial [Bacteroidales bacterium]
VKTDEDRLAAGKALVNPLDATAENLARGEEAYGIYCIDCHGPSGDGQGYLFTSGRYPYPPKNLLLDEVKALREGEIYHVITVGYGIMGPHGSMIRPEDRWKIILYLRENLQKQTP